MGSTTLFAVIVAVSNAIVAIFTYIMARRDKQVKKEQKIEEANKKLEEACNHGSLSDLIDATKQIGEAKR